MIDEKFTLVFEPETDGSWIADCLEFPGVLSYGVNEIDAAIRALCLLNRVVAEERRFGANPKPQPVEVYELAENALLLGYSAALTAKADPGHQPTESYLWLRLPQTTKPLTTSDTEFLLAIFWASVNRTKAGV
jgi:predicted RNase H-like HicB family nuclease